MVAFLYRMPSGFPGRVNRAGTATIIPAIFDAEAMPTAYGVAMKMQASGKITPFQSGDNAETLAFNHGILVSPYPTQGGQADAIGAVVPNCHQIANVLQRGFISVLLNGSAPAKPDGQVYVRVGNASADKPIGGFEAALDIVVDSTRADGNTGDGKLDALSVAAPAEAGQYVVVFTAETAFNLTNPHGALIAQGKTGNAVSVNGLSFTITVGDTAFVAGDSFTVTVTRHTLVYPNARFTGAADSGSNTEIAYNI